jgi:membrane protein EpsK
MSVWVLINGIGLLLNTSVALFIVNKLFGEVANAEYYLALIWSSLLITIAFLVTSLFTPMTYVYYARRDREGLVHFTSMTVKCVGLLMALPIALVCIFSPQLLTIWVGAEFAHLSPLVWVLVAPVILSIMVSCISPITVAYDRIRNLVMLTLPLGFANIILAILLPNFLDIGMYGVALASLITLILRYGVVNPLYIASIVEIPIFTYLKNMLYGVGGLVILSIGGMALVSMIHVYTLPTLIFIGSVISAVYLLIVLKIVLYPEERLMIRSSLPGVLKKWIPSWLL